MAAKKPAAAETMDDEGTIGGDDDNDNSDERIMRSFPELFTTKAARAKPEHGYKSQVFHAVRKHMGTESARHAYAIARRFWLEANPNE